MIQKHIAVVILNYNTEKDLPLCAEQIARQEGIRLSIILVDNASQAESLAAIKLWLAGWCPEAVCGTLDEVHSLVRQNPGHSSESGNVYLIENNENRGYSAGNNIGIRLADTLKADAVLIANPDMRIEDPLYLTGLSSALFADDSHCIAATRIVGLDGKDQNPLREPGFWAEMFWPRFYLSKFLKPISYVLTIPIAGTNPVIVPKVSGCCMLLRMSFLQATDYLDEGVFLYCEEPILSARVRSAGGQIVFVPSLSAVHAHLRSEKGNPSGRMLLFIKSRQYYLVRYSDYGKLQRSLLGVSYLLLGALHTVKMRIFTRIILLLIIEMSWRCAVSIA